MVDTQSGTMETFKDRAVKCLQHIAHHFGELGRVLIDAGKVSQDEYEELKGFLLNRNLKQADLDAAIKVAKGEVAEALFFAGVASSKILVLNQTDQKRLMSGEEFGLKTATGVVYKAWDKMDVVEKNQLIGRGGIKVPEKQIVRGSIPQKVITVYEYISYEDGKDGQVLRLKYGDKEGEIALGFVALQLRDAGKLNALISDLLSIQSKYELKAA
jgi:hypothetical protein